MSRFEGSELGKLQGAAVKPQEIFEGVCEGFRVQTLRHFYLQLWDLLISEPWKSLFADSSLERYRKSIVWKS